MSLLNSVLESQLLSIERQDKSNLAEYFEYAIDENHSEQQVVLPSSWINSRIFKDQIQALFEHYSLKGLIEVGQIWSTFTGISFTILVLSKKRNKKILMAEFRPNPVDRGLTGNIFNNGELPNFEYTENFKSFLLKVENAIVNGSSNTVDSLFTIDANKLDISRLQVSFYHPDNQLEIGRYKKSKFQLLDELVKVISVRKLKNKSIGKVFSWGLIRDLKSGELPLKSSEATSHKLVCGEIIITCNLKKAFVVPVELEGCYAPLYHSFV